ncbi:cation:proton antiporter [Entomospira entomophila]|uniref:Sodium:proton antiporter n=1 Tax=Entomospira entomophila TaxID=2719988 RepID=A0A968KS04_9SPIO|nr:cation:proton antiporter [Entomospira entomophilus]NIZ41249.1 sodium:proton antiporter [Entomospira entomophilus]WDI35454.1 cation:proton antiporter [Entomospira entomophilus]
MLLMSFGLTLISGLLFGKVASLMKLPPILGMIVGGIIVGPAVLNWIDPSLLALSPTFRKVALFIILLRAGLSLNLREVRNLGSTTIYLTIIPALFEIIAYTLLGHLLLSLPLLEAALLGSVIAAVSPAIIVPRMISLLNQPSNPKIPQLLISASSLDDILVIIIFTSLLSLSLGQSISVSYEIRQLLLSALGGVFIGWFIAKTLNAVNQYRLIPQQAKFILLLAMIFILGSAEDLLFFAFSGLLAIMSLGIILNQQWKDQTKDAFQSLWKVAEIWLFVLVGAQLSLSNLASHSALFALIIIVALFIRLLGVFLALRRSGFTSKEKLYCAFSYIPKATVQASIGSLALEAGVQSGELILTIAILAILITAPLGAFLMDTFRDTLLMLNKTKQKR